MATMGKWGSARMERLLEALLDAFPQRVAIDQLLWFGFKENLDAITNDFTLSGAFFAVIRWACARGYLDRLLEEACRRNSGNPKLRALADDKAPFLVPFPKDTEFVGRGADLDRLHQLLQNGAFGARRAALVGMGGVGKTQLAVEYAHCHRDDYPGGVYWVHAAAPLVSEIGALAERLSLREDVGPEAERPGQRLRAFERYLHENPGALVIFDNTANPLALREPTAGVIPWELPCHMLFTTRRRDHDARFETVLVSGLPEDAALRLLLSSQARKAVLDVGRLDEQQAAKAICSALGHLPLAIVLAAAYLGKSPGLTLSDYLRRLYREGVLTTTDAAKVDSSRLTTQHEAAVEATLRAQWDALVTRDARQALKAAALLRNSAHVSRATLALLSGLSDQAEGGYPAPLEVALNELLEWSLVEELTRKAIRLHPLVREFAAARISREHKTFPLECARRLDAALGEVGRLEEEVQSRELDAVLADLRLGEELGGAEERERFRRLLRTLDREAHCLRRWDPAREPGFFLQQVRNVSFELGMEEVQEQAEAALRARGCTWLRERLRTSRESEALVRTLAGHTSSVWGVAVMADGRSALSASHDGTLKVWEISSGCELRTLAGHSSQVNGVAVTSDGRLAVSASDDRTLMVWELASGRLLHTLAGHSSQVNGVAVTPDGRFAVSASADNTLKVWELASGRLVHTLAGHERAVNGVVVTPDGRFAVSAAEDETLMVWELANGRRVHTVKGHAEAVMDVAVTPDGHFLVSASADNTLKVWELASGRLVRTLEGHDGWVNGVAVTPDGRLAVSASSDNTLKVWELASGCMLYTLEGHTESVKGVAVTPNGRLAISTSHDNTLKVWELSSGRELGVHEGHTHDVPGVAVASDGRFAVSASWDKTLKVWDLSTLDQVRTLKGHTALVMRVAVTPDGALAVSASHDKTLKVWDLASGRELRTLSGHTRAVNGVAVTPDSCFAVSASEDMTLKVWELANGRELRTLAGHAGGVTGAAVTPDGCWAISSSGDRTLKIWDLLTGQEKRTLLGHTNTVTGVTVTPDGRFAVSASEDMTLKVWDLLTGRVMHTLTGHTSTVTGVAVTPNGRFAISASEDTTLRVWDLADGRFLATLEAHAPLLSCAVAPDGCTFFAGDGAGSLHVLDWILPRAGAGGPLQARPAAARSANDGSPHLRVLSSGSATCPAPETAPTRGAPIHPPFFGVAGGGAGAPAAPAASAVEPPAAGRIKILFLASNPLSTTQIHLTREARRIEELLSTGKRRDSFEFVTQWAVRRSDLQRLLLEEKPHVLHFSSHGSTRAQLFLEDDEGNAAPVTKKALVDLIGILKHRMQLVVLNACDTEPLARALVQHVACAIGMRQSIGDDAAIAFAVSLYQALAFNEPIATAFQLACNELKIQQIPEEQTPTLKVKKGIDARTLVFTSQMERGYKG